ncbi:hypothetical protein D3C77_618580 [compost metagenome]
MGAWVYTLRQQLLCGIPAFAGLGERDSGVGAYGQHFRLAFESVADAPQFAAGRGDLEA